MMNTIFIDSMNQIEITNTWAQFYNVFFNTGNLIFSECCKKEISYSNICKFDRKWEEAEKNQVYVLPLSNNLSTDDTYFTRILYRLARYNLNVVPIGLGVQASINETPKEFMKRIPHRKKRLFYQLASNTVTVGVRGEFTAECLNIIGIRNTRIIGCPSFYSNLLKREQCNEHILQSDEKKICINWDFNTNGKVKIENDLYEKKYVIQTMPEWVKMKKGNLGNCDIFFSINDWYNWMQDNKFGFAVGNRFHGNMVCYLNKIPTLFLGWEKDRRIAELVETLGLPIIPIQSQGYDVDKLKEIKLYTNEFYQKRKHLRNLYVDFLNENGVCHKFEG